MTNLFLLFENRDEEGYAFLGAFSTLEKAQDAVPEDTVTWEHLSLVEGHTPNPYSRHFIIEPYVVDKPYN